MQKIGVIHYNWPGFSFAEFLQYANQIGCTHVELMLSDITDQADLAGNLDALKNAAAKVRAEVESYGLAVSAFGASNNFIQPDEAGIEREVERMRRACVLTKVLGEDTVVRSEGGFANADMDTDAQWESMRECFRRCIPFLEELNVSLAIDNHGLVTNEGDRLITMLNELNHPRLGSNLDTMNFRWLGNSVEDCDRFYRQLAPRVLHAHFKDGFNSRDDYQGAALGEGELHLQVALDALKDAGYAGVYTAEYEGPETEGGVGYRKCVEWLKQNT
jgi:sugar phosphate isomerase/epimerase